MYRFIDHSIRANVQLEGRYREALLNNEDGKRVIIVLRGAMFFCATQ